MCYFVLHEVFLSTDGLVIFSKIPLTFLNFNFTHILHALFEARCYALHKGGAVCIDFLMRKQ